MGTIKHDGAVFAAFYVVGGAAPIGLEECGFAVEHEPIFPSRLQPLEVGRF
jgi:hypothetical protein